MRHITTICALLGWLFGLVAGCGAVITRAFEGIWEDPYLVHWSAASVTAARLGAALIVLSLAAPVAARRADEYPKTCIAWLVVACAVSFALPIAELADQYGNWEPAGWVASLLSGVLFASAAVIVITSRARTRHHDPLLPAIE
jgi:hypothetical protein